MAGANACREESGAQRWAGLHNFPGEPLGAEGGLKSCSRGWVRRGRGSFSVETGVTLSGLAALGGWYSRARRPGYRVGVLLELFAPHARGRGGAAVEVSSLREQAATTHRRLSTSRSY